MFPHLTYATVPVFAGVFVPVVSVVPVGEFFEHVAGRMEQAVITRIF
jgi:hypothetical protein